MIRPTQGARMFVFLALVLTASAQEAEPTEAAETAETAEPPPFTQTDPELAIPADKAPGKRPGQGPAQHRDSPGETMARLQLARSYQAQRLEVLTELEFTPGTTTTMRGGPGPYWGPRRRYGWSPTTVTHTPASIERQWGVYQGSSRVDVPTYLNLTGQIGEAQALDDQLAKLSRRSRVGLTVGGVGVAALIGGVVAMGLADTPEAGAAASAAVGGGAALTFGGLIGGAISSGRVDKLRYRPADYMELGEVRAAINVYNDELADELGLSPADRALMDTERRPGRPPMRR